MLFKISFKSAKFPRITLIDPNLIFQQFFPQNIFVAINFYLSKNPLKLSLPSVTLSINILEWLTVLVCPAATAASATD